jgi:hypothetical protein
MGDTSGTARYWISTVIDFKNPEIALRRRLNDSVPFL